MVAWSAEVAAANVAAAVSQTNMALIDESRLVTPDDEPETAFTLMTGGEPLLVTDPT